MRDGGKTKEQLISELVEMRQRVAKLEASETQRQPAAEELRQSGEHFRALIENASDAVAILDAEGIIVYESPSAERILGYGPQDLVGKSMLEFIHPDDVPNVAGIFAAILNNPRTPMSTELRFRHKDDSWHWLEGVGNNLLDDPQVQGVVANYRDITERKRVEEVLRESEAKYAALVEQAVDGVMIAQDGVFRFTNEAMTEISGYTVEEMAGMPFLDMVVPELRHLVARRFRSRMAGKKLPPAYETKIQCKDGTVKEVEARSRTIQYQGRPANFSVVRDVTERKRAEEKLQEAYERESELRLRLEQEMKRRVEFTRGLVHELKTPVTAIVASSGLLVEELPEGPLLRLATNIDRSISRLDKRIDELLDIARGEMGMLRLNRLQLDPLEMLRSVAGEMAPVASNRGQSLVLELPSSLPPVWADERRLREVVLNLLDNAFKWTPDGGRITLRAREDNDNLVVEVEDAGPGIAKKDQQWVFEPYYHVKSAGSRLNGLGLGLALCKRLIERHGGKIWVNSRKGKGSTFGFSVPLRADVD